MRNFINMITEGDVVPFKKPAVEPALTQDQKYRGAGAYKASGLGMTLTQITPSTSILAGLFKDILLNLRLAMIPTQSINRSLKMLLLSSI
jgi:hypothetical protein